MSGAQRSLRLEPKASVKTTLDVRPFGVVRKTGGERHHYSFAVGPLRTTSWFYYADKFHGPMFGAAK